MSNVYKLKSKTKSLEDLVERFDRIKSDSQRVCEAAAKAILKALDAKDNYTFDHSVRVCYYSLILGLELDLPDQELYDIQLAALFHDIGKIGTPDAVLNKPTRLNDIEFRIMQKHPGQSFEILDEMSELKTVALYAKHHHERYDGKGYPDGLIGEKIPMASRIILIADTFDAMTSERVYRKAFPFEVAYTELTEFAGTQFDPKLVDTFIKAMQSREEENAIFIPLFDKHFSKKAA